MGTREIVSIASGSKDPSQIEITEAFYKKIGWDTDRETLEVAFLMTKIFSGFDMITSIGLLLVSCFMIYGIKKEKDRFLLPAIYYIPIDGVFSDSIYGDVRISASNFFYPKCILYCGDHHRL